MQVQEDLTTIEKSIGELLNVCNQISKSCTDYRDAILELRVEIQGFIEAIIAEAALNVAVTVVATCLTGVGGVIAGVKAVESARRWSIKIKDAVSAWRVRKVLQLRGLTDDVAAAMKSAWKAVEDLYNRLRAPGRPSKVSAAKLTDKDLDALGSYTGGGYRDINRALRDGNVRPDQQDRIDNINSALNKLPSKEGTMYRGTDLSPEVLASYKEGEVVTEKAFTSTSSDPGRAFPGNTRFTVESKTGKDVAPYSTAEQNGMVENEVLFRSGTKFHVVSKDADPDTGITYIHLAEVG
ncbi:ADP-ribosyltransferase [Nocardia mangyaensis]|uniref:ADP-ribosyltransferase n=1 Tax=Nocardia mangyaensis TaxID=2213200 RepID=UPI00267639EE|nr:ADP-ribosyltransferase [Nocardia mangyaensis]MDO3651212.1 ADP-ribosyltransferase [Nocardia mangyaensis]